MGFIMYIYYVYMIVLLYDIFVVVCINVLCNHSYFFRTHKYSFAACSL